MESATGRATRRNELRALIARIPGVRGRTGLLIAEVLEPHFAAEDDVLERTHTLVTAHSAAQELHAQTQRAAQEAQVGTSAHRIERSREFERLESEGRVAQVALGRARDELERAVATYHTFQSELIDDPAPL